MFIKTILAGCLIRTHSELKVAHVTGSQLDSQQDIRSRVVLPYNHAQTVLSAVFIVSWQRSIKRVSADSALALVRLPLPRETTTVQLMVIVIRRGLEAISPR